MVAISKQTWSRSSRGMRVETAFSVMLEGIPQRELDQARGPLGVHDLAKGTVGRTRQIRLDIGHCRVGEIDVIPQVKEVGGEAQVLALLDREMLDQRKIPVLLEWTTIDVAAQVAEVGPTEVAGGVSRAQRGIELRSGRESGWIQVAVDALVDVTVGKTTGDGCAGGETGTQQGRTAGAQKSRASG